MSNNPAKYEVQIKQYLHSIPDISVFVMLYKLWSSFPETTCKNRSAMRTWGLMLNPGHKCVYVMLYKL